MPFTEPAGVQDTSLLTYGEWPVAYAIADPLGAATVVAWGGVREGVVRVTRTEIELMDTVFPQTVAHSVPASVAFECAGNALELSAGVLHALVGDDGPDGASLYMYPAANCPSTDTDFSFRMERENCDARMVLAHIWRGRNVAGLEITGAADYITSPFTVKALDDRAGAFGGSNAVPLGYIWVSS